MDSGLTGELTDELVLITELLKLIKALSSLSLTDSQGKGCILT